MVHLAFLGWSMPFTPAQPDPMSELHRWKAQPELRQEILHVGDIDADGLVYLAGESGLLRYDGREVVQFEFPDSWPEMGTAKDIMASTKGSIFALYENGLIRLNTDKKFELLRRMAESPDKSTAIAETEDGTVWIATREGLYRIASTVTLQLDDGFSPIRALEVDTRGNLWIANDKNEIGIFHHDPEAGSALELLERIELSPQLAGSHSQIYRKPEGTMWLLIAHPVWTVVEFAEKRVIQSIPIPDGFESAIGFDYCPMPDGRIIFTEKSTTAQFYRGKWTLLNLEDYPVATHESFAIALPGNQLLIGGSHTQRHLIDLSNRRWTTYLDLIFCDEDKDGKQWFIHKDRYVVVLDPETNQWSVLTTADGLIDAPNAVYCASDGTVWISGMHGKNAALSYLRKGDWSLHEFPTLGYTLGHLGICEFPDGSMIFGNGSDDYYDSRAGGAVHFRPLEGRFEVEILSSPLYPERPYCITAQGTRGLWIGGRNFYFKSGPDSRDLEMMDRYQRSWIDHMIVDEHDHLWVANWRQGLFRYDGEHWEEMRMDDGQSSVQAAFILEGKHQKGIWIGNTRGLHRFDGETWSRNVLAGNFRFPKEGSTLVEGNKGDLWLNFSCRDWLLNSPILRDNRAHLHRTIRYRADGEAPVTQFTRLEDELSEPANAIFSWNGQDRWEDTQRDNLEYSFRLSGRDWTPFSKRTEIALLDLPHGDYTLEVRARDQDLNVDPSPATASFRVIPPLWKQAWFILVLAGIIASTLLLIYIIIRQRIKYSFALSEFKIDFFTNLSHELRTPLSVILGPLQRLIQHADSSKDRQSLEMIQRNANKMLGLVNQLLEFRKVELGKLEFHPSTGELIGFIKDAVYSLSPLWEQKGQTVHIELDEGPFRCSFDPDKLIRIIDNLLSNAIKYTPEGGEIRVSAEVMEDSRNHSVLNLRIVDTGVGIPDSSLKRITEPFYTARNTEHENPSSGIGLALVKELVDLWNGSIAIESEIKGPRKGTRVQVSVPLFPPTTEEESLTERHEEEEPGAGTGGTPCKENQANKKRVLIIEDNPDLRAFLESELASQYDIDTAENGLTGIEHSLKHPPDLILSDVMMPEMDGIELCKKIRETTDISHVPIILLTAQTGEAHYLEGIESGADEYFSKPISIPKLIARIENLLQSREKLHALFAEQVVLEPGKIAVVPSDQLFLQNAIKIAEKNMQTETFDVEAFAKQMAVSRATLNRKIKAITGTSPKAFIRSMRMKRAAHLLASSDLPINEIFFQVGFYDASNFSRVFRKEFGMTPSQYREGHEDPDVPAAPTGPAAGAAQTTAPEGK